MSQQASLSRYVDEHSIPCKGFSRRYQLKIEDQLKALDIDVTLQQFMESRFAGGNYKPKLEYWERFSRVHGLKMPPHHSQCICGMGIEKQCYILTPNHKTLVVGSCCINRFLLHGTKRTCMVCTQPTRTRHSVCQTCQEQPCPKCHTLFTTLHTMCVLCAPLKQKHAAKLSGVDMTKYVAVSLPPWVHDDGMLTLEQRGMEWEGQRWLTGTHFYMFKYAGMHAPWEPASPTVYYTKYKLPERQEEREEMLESLSPDTELSWRPFLNLVKSDGSVEGSQTPFVLLDTVTSTLLFELVA